MNKYILGFVLFLLAQEVPAQDYWFPRDTVKGSPKSASCAVSLPQVGLIIGGLDDFGFKRKMYSYSPFKMIGMRKFHLAEFLGMDWNVHLLVPSR